jgi:hypothetical protein
MDYIYIVIENGNPYSLGFITYKSAVRSVKEKHREYLKDQIKQLDDFFDIENIVSDINVSENTETNITKLYIEKGINIEIHKIQIIH